MTHKEIEKDLFKKSGKKVRPDVLPVTLENFILLSTVVLGLMESVRKGKKNDT